MCLALPARVTRLIPPGNALVSLSGVQREISLALVDDVAPGDYVIVHVGYALSKLEPAEAEKTLALIRRQGAAKTPSAARTEKDGATGGKKARQRGARAAGISSAS
jgi:hydrogenase expression/formation protein HypC